MDITYHDYRLVLKRIGLYCGGRGKEYLDARKAWKELQAVSDEKQYTLLRKCLSDDEEGNELARDFILRCAWGLNGFRILEIIKRMVRKGDTIALTVLVGLLKSEDHHGGLWKEIRIADRVSYDPMTGSTSYKKLRRLDPFEVIEPGFAIVPHGLGDRLCHELLLELLAAEDNGKIARLVLDTMINWPTWSSFKLLVDFISSDKQRNPIWLVVALYITNLAKCFTTEELDGLQIDWRENVKRLVPVIMGPNNEEVGLRFELIWVFESLPVPEAVEAIKRYIRECEDNPLTFRPVDGLYKLLDHVIGAV